VRDYIHVTDIADAHVRALDYLFERGKSCALNLANSSGYSIKEVVAVAEKVCACSIEVETGSRRSGDPPILIGDASKARTLLDWKPVHSDLETQIRHAWNWMLRSVYFQGCGPTQGQAR
jgi:UDP-glucose 4-epimerase